MRELVHDLADILKAGRPAAYTALVETRGSTPQKPGAVMLVFADGSQVGTLGGGCVEAEVKQRALRLLDQGESDILTFQLDGDYGWDDGLICGGRMKMLVDPLIPGEDLSYYRKLCEMLSTGIAFTETVLLESETACIRHGARFLFSGEGELLAARGAVDPPQHVVAHLKPLTVRPRPYVQAGVSYLPRMQRIRLVIVGGGHVGRKVAELAADVDFEIWVVDDRESYCNAERFPQAKRLLVGDIAGSLSGLSWDYNTFCIIVTRGHSHDEEALYHVAETAAGYVGMIGSRRKIKLIFEDLLREGISRESLARVHAPLGFDIGSQTVPEIAVSIVAELIAQRNLGQVELKSTKISVIDDVPLGI